MNPFQSLCGTQGKDSRSWCHGFKTPQSQGGSWVHGRYEFAQDFPSKKHHEADSITEGSSMGDLGGAQQESTSL